MPNTFLDIFRESQLDRIERKQNRLMRRMLNLEDKFDRAILDSSEAGRMSNQLQPATRNLRKAVADNPLPKK